MTAGLADRIGSIGAPGVERVAFPVAVVPLIQPKKESLEPPRRRVVSFSDQTATYDSRGAFPVMKMFQISRPLPEYKPFGNLLSELPPAGGTLLLNASYARDRSSPNRFVDRQV